MRRRLGHRFMFAVAVAAAVLCVATAAVFWMQRRNGPERRSDPAACLSRLSRATTAAEEERDALDDLWREATENQWPLSLTVYDGSGAALSASDPAWPRKAVTVDVAVRGRSVTHRVIDGDNLLLLMRE